MQLLIQMNYLNKYTLAIIFLFFIGLGLRFIFLTQVPPSINWDEASLGVNAYSILKTGKDEWGKVLPVTFEAFGDYKLPGYIYTLVPFVAALGLNDLSVRLPSVLFGSLSIIFLYLGVLELTRDKKWALLSAGLLTISPWHFFLSRIALEANLAFSFFLIGLYFLIIGLRKKTMFLLGSLFFGFSIFTYNSARIFVPLFLLGFIILFWKQIKLTKTSIAAGIIFGFFLALGFYLAVFQDSSARYYWVRILDDGAINFLEQARNRSAFNPLFTNLIYNRITYFIYNFGLNYLKHLSIQFLAISGGNNYQFSVQNMGLIYLAELPFLFFGFYKLSLRCLHLKLLKQKIGWIFLGWLLIAPIPSALTREAPQALRSIFMLGSIQVITAFGLIQIFSIIAKRKFLKNFSLAIVGFLIALNAFYYFKIYFKDYPVKYSEAWQYGYKQTVDKVLENYDKYPKIYFTKKYGEPHIFYLFFSKYDPKKYQENSELVRYAKSNWRWVDRLDKIYFVNDWEMKKTLENEKEALVVSTPGNYPERAEKLETIYFLDRSKAFEIVKI